MVALSLLQPSNRWGIALVRGYLGTSDLCATHEPRRGGLIV